MLPVLERVASDDLLNDPLPLDAVPEGPSIRFHFQGLEPEVASVSCSVGPCALCLLCPASRLCHPSGVGKGERKFTF